MHVLKNLSVLVFSVYLVLVLLLVFTVADYAIATLIFVALTLLMVAYAISRFIGYRKTSIVGLKFFLVSGLPSALIYYNPNRLGSIGSWMAIIAIIAMSARYFWSSFWAALDNEVPLVKVKEEVINGQ
jgi:hypothetical protein